MVPRTSEGRLEESIKWALIVFVLFMVATMIFVTICDLTGPNIWCGYGMTREQMLRIEKHIHGLDHL